MLQYLINKKIVVINKKNESANDYPGEGGFLLNDQSFDKIKREFKVWMKENYPTLTDDYDNILADVFKKLQKKIGQQKETISGESLRDMLLKLVDQECQYALPTAENAKKNMGLMRSQFKQMVADLKDGNEYLIEQVYLSHFEKCVRYLKSNRKCSHDDAHESTLDALLEIRKELIAEKIFYGNLGYYFTKRAQNKLYKIQVKKQYTVEIVDGLEVEDPESFEKIIYQSQFQQIVAESLDKISPSNRELLKLFYYDELSFKEIAKKLNKNHDAVRQEAKRCRNKLRDMLGEDFYKKFSSYFK